MSRDSRSPGVGAGEAQIHCHVLVCAWEKCQGPKGNGRLGWEGSLGYSPPSMALAQRCPVCSLCRLMLMASSVQERPPPLPGPKDRGTSAAKVLGEAGGLQLLRPCTRPRKMHPHLRQHTLTSQPRTQGPFPAANDLSWWSVSLGITAIPSVRTGTSVGGGLRRLGWGHQSPPPTPSGPSIDL